MICTHCDSATETSPYCPIHRGYQYGTIGGGSPWVFDESRLDRGVRLLTGRSVCDHCGQYESDSGENAQSISLALVEELRRLQARIDAVQGLLDSSGCDCSMSNIGGSIRCLACNLRETLRLRR